MISEKYFPVRLWEFSSQNIYDSSRENSRIIPSLQWIENIINNLMLLIMLPCQNDQYIPPSHHPSFRGFYFVIKIPCGGYPLCNMHKSIKNKHVSFWDWMLLNVDPWFPNKVINPPISCMIHFAFFILVAVKLITKPDRRRSLQ